ncbi:spinster family MFS transporter [Altererythrobacter sp. MF3-039]|uniref:spinster family MFS transporter n=1 Tax=Altererythrobacter sp. MF3-039 TaxID=3252901 RepID=UPI00390C64B8
MPSPSPNALSPEVTRTSAVALTLLTAAYVLSFIDRTIIALMVGPIRADLGISDTQFSLLGGLAFALFYTTLGIPLGWWADRGDRPKIIALGIALWSLMTMACGLASRFITLFIARMGVGVGEAALSPAAYSLISETTKKEKLGVALTIYSSGVYLGIGLSFAIGGVLVETLGSAPPLDLGFLGELKGWQQVFLIAGAPGLVIAPLCWFLLPESRRVGSAPDPSQSPPIIGWMGGHKTFLLCHFFGFSMLTMAFNGYLAWTAEFLLRNFAMDKATGGGWLGLIVLFAGVGGMLIGGRVADKLLSRGDGRGALTAAIFASVALVPFAASAPMMPSAALSLAMLAPVVFLSAFCFGLAVISLQLATPERLRARISAIYLLVVNLTGIGLGGTLVAAISDHVLGGEGMRIGEAMAIVGGAATLIAVPLIFTARRTMPHGE